MADSSLKRKTAVSLFWSFLDKFGQQILNFASMLILMNIVATDDYGMIGSLAIFVAFSSILIDSGFGRALLNRKNLSPDDYSTVFYFNVSLAFVLYLLLFFLAPVFADIFHTPALIPVARVLFLSLLFNAFGLIQQTILTKRADFKGLTRINLWALLLADVVAIVLAVNNFGVWALVVQTVFYAFLRTLFLWFYSSWRLTTRFSLESLKSFFAFSNKLLATSVISTTINNIYPSLIAVFYPMSKVAYFNQAKKYQEIPFLTLSNTFRQVAMLILSEINTDTERLRRVVSKLMKAISFLSFPIGFLMIIVAEPLFILFFKDKWLPAVPYFQILTFAGMISPFVFIFNELFIAKERPRYFLGVEIAKGIILLILIVLLFPKGIIGLALSWIAYMLITVLLSAVLSGKLIGYGLVVFLKDCLPYLLVALVCSAISYFATQNIQNNLLHIATNTFLIGLSYIFLCKLLKMEMLKEIEKSLKTR